MRTISWFTDMFLEEFGSTVPADGRARLGQVVAGATRMNRLIDDLLNFSRFSRAPLTRRPVDLDSMVRRLAAECQARESGRSVRVEIEELPAVEGDASLLEQVFVNLLSNAFKFTRDSTDPHVTIGSCMAPGETEPHEPECIYFVRDNGAGFDMKHAGKLFGVFQRMHAQDQFDGTGIGLSIVQRIVQRHGGRIWADSAPGRGATFYFVL